jgi:hypothetical protein
MKVEKKQNPSIFLATSGTYHENLAICKEILQKPANLGQFFS